MKILQKRNTKKISSRISLRKLLVSRKQFLSKDSKGNTLKKSVMVPWPGNRGGSKGRKVAWQSLCSQGPSHCSQPGNRVD